MLTALEVFIGLKLKSLVLQPTPPPDIFELHVLNKQCAADLIKVMMLHEALEMMQKYVATRKEESRTFA